MSSGTGTDSGAVTVAFSVAKFTVAKTLSIVFSFFSTLAAHVIPCTENSTSLSPECGPPVTAADDMPRHPPGKGQEPGHSEPVRQGLGRVTT
jgi:hypothetical protein